MCLYTISLHSPIPLYFDMHLLTPSLSLSYTFAGYTFPPHLSIGLSLAHSTYMSLSQFLSPHLALGGEKQQIKELD